MYFSTVYIYKNILSNKIYWQIYRKIFFILGVKRYQYRTMSTRGHHRHIYGFQWRPWIKSLAKFINILRTSSHTVLPMTCMLWRPAKLNAGTLLMWLSWIRSSTKVLGRFLGMEVRRLCEIYNFCKRFNGRNALASILEIWLYLKTSAWWG